MFWDVRIFGGAKAVENQGLGSPTFFYFKYTRGLIFPPMSKTDLTTAQVAERMGVSVHAVRFWIKRGLLPNAYELAESRGAVWKIPESDLEGFEPPKKTGRPPKADGAAGRKRAAKKGGKK